MSKFSDYAANRILDHICGRSTFSRPTTRLGIATTTIAADDAGSDTDEPVGGSYARQSTSWSAASARTITNSAAITFTALTGVVTITDAFLTDSGSVGAGNVLAYGPLVGSVTVPEGGNLVFPAGSLIVTLP